MTNSEKLRALADWFDQYDAKQKNDFDKVSNQVQSDLRAMATEFEQLQQHGVSGKRPFECPNCHATLQEVEMTNREILDALAACASGAVDKTVRDGLYCNCTLPNRNTTGNWCGTCNKMIAGNSVGRF